MNRKIWMLMPVFSILALLESGCGDDKKKKIAAVEEQTPAEDPAITVTIGISPASAGLLAGATQKFTAVVKNSDDKSVTWSVVESAGGAITSGGLYTAPAAAGTYTVKAVSKADKTKSATAKVTVSLPPPVAVVLTATHVEVFMGNTVTFTASIANSSNQGVSWTVQEGAAGGTISSEGVYNAPQTPGTYHIIVTSLADATKTATITVVVPDISVAFDDASPYTVTEATITFTANVGGTYNTDVTWYVIGVTAGTINEATGVYDAPTTPGTYQVIATSLADPSKTAVLTVNVVVVTLSMDTTPITVFQKESHPFTVTVSGTVITGVTLTIREGSGGGSITSNGIYTAPATAGVYHVDVTSVADPRRYTAVEITVPIVEFGVSALTADVFALESASFSGWVTGRTDTSLVWSVLEADGGSVTQGGVYTAPVTQMTYTVRAYSSADATLYEDILITVPTISVWIDPLSERVFQGETATFSATVSNSSSQSVSYFVEGGAVNGTVTSGGVYSAPLTVGTYYVVASSDVDPTKTSTATVTVPDLSVTIDQGTQVTVYMGETTTITATVDGTSNANVTWEVDDVNGGAINPTNGDYTAPVIPGVYHVTVRSDVNPVKSDTIVIYVFDIEIDISPSFISVDPDATVTLAAQVYYTYNDAVTWYVVGVGSGTVNAGNGDYTAPSTAGTYEVIAVSDADPSKTAMVTIQVVATSIAIDPTTVTLYADHTTTFSATVIGPIDTSYTFEVQEGAAGGSVTSGGVYTSPLVGGTYHVIARSVANAAKTAVATITVSNPTVQVTPATATVYIGESADFNALVQNSPDSLVYWDVSEFNGGTVDNNGLYTAPATPGTYHVVASSNRYPTKSSYSTITVPPVSITVGPDPVSVYYGATQQFTGTLVGSSNQNITWELDPPTFGSINQSGLYTAPLVAGSVVVIARSAAFSAVTGTSVLTVESIPIDVTTSTTCLTPEEAVSFHASVTNVTWTVESADGGSIDEDGLYTAPVTPGTYTIKATSNLYVSDFGTTTINVLALKDKVFTFLDGAGTTVSSQIRFRYSTTDLTTRTRYDRFFDQHRYDVTDSPEQSWFEMYADDVTAVIWYSGAGVNGVWGDADDVITTNGTILLSYDVGNVETHFTKYNSGATVTYSIPANAALDGDLLATRSGGNPNRDNYFNSGNDLVRLEHRATNGRLVDGIGYTTYAYAAGLTDSSTTYIRKAATACGVASNNNWITTFSASDHIGRVRAYTYDGSNRLTLRTETPYTCVDANTDSAGAPVYVHYYYNGAETFPNLVVASPNLDASNPTRQATISSVCPW